MRDASFFIATALEIGAVALGFYWRFRDVDLDRPTSFYTHIAALAGLFMLAGAGLSLVTKTVNAPRCRSLVCIGSLIYSAGIVLFEPFLFTGPNGMEVIVAALVLTPLVVAIQYLVHAGAWMSVIGAILFVFTSSAMIADNSYCMYSASGFFHTLQIRQ
jgi:hypothetical protein